MSIWAKVWITFVMGASTCRTFLYRPTPDKNVTSVTEKVIVAMVDVVFTTMALWSVWIL